jgi:hypothetical protein
VLILSHIGEKRLPRKLRLSQTSVDLSWLVSRSGSTCVCSFIQIAEEISLITFIAHSDSDPSLISADGVTFKVHLKNLTVHSTVLANAVSITNTATLPERAEVLELLVKFMYRQPQPNLNNVHYSALADLAKAASKYQVTAAMHRSEMAQK